jgi:hypothetical protein
MTKSIAIIHIGHDAYLMSKLTIVPSSLSYVDGVDERRYFST